MGKAGFSNLLTKRYNMIRQSYYNKYVNNKEESHKDSYHHPVEAGLVKTFFEGIERRARLSIKKMAKRAIKLSAPKKAVSINKRPAVILRQVNGVVYEYHLSKCFTAPALNAARISAGLEPLPPKVKYVRAIHPLTKDGFKFVCNARRMRYSVKKVRRGIPQKPSIRLVGDQVVFNLKSDLKVQRFTIPVVKNKYAGAIPDESRSSGFANDRIPNHIRKAIKESRRERNLTNRYANLGKKMMATLRARSKVSEMVGPIERDQQLLMKLRDIISQLKAKRSGICHSQYWGSNSYPKNVQHEMGLSDLISRKFSAKADVIMDKISENILEDSREFIKEKFEDLFTKVKDFIPNGLNEYKAQTVLIFFTNIIHDFRNKRFLSSIGNNVVGILSSLELIKGQTFVLSAAVTNYFKCIYDSTVTEKSLNVNINIVKTEIEHQMDTHAIAGPASTLVLAIAGVVGLKLSKTDTFPDFFTFKNIKDFTSCVNSMTIFLKNHLEALIKCFEWCHAKVNRYILHKMVSEQPEDIQSFLREASLYAYDSAMYDRIVNSPELQHKVFRLFIQAGKLNAALGESRSAGQLSTTIRSILSKLSYLQERLINDCITPNVGYEPWVCQLTGPAGVGKSTIVSRIVPELLKSINYKAINEMVFTRSIGVDFWNGISNQPFILYDDMFIEENSAPVQLAEWMQLKSAAPFNPNCAHLEDKKRRISPIGLIINSNRLYFEGILTFMYEPEAINRRRDILWWVDFDIVYDGKTEADQRKKILAELGDFRRKNGYTDYSRYRFYRVRNVIKPISNDFFSNFEKPVLYEEFLERTKVNFKEYRRQELIAYEERFNQLTAPVTSEGFLSNEALDRVLQDRINKYVDLVENSDTGSFMHTVRRLVDSGRASIFGMDINSVMNPLKTTQEKIEILQKAIVSSVNKTIDPKSLNNFCDSQLQHEMDNGRENTIETSVDISNSSSVVHVDQSDVNIINQSINNQVEVNTIAIEREETFAHLAGHEYLYKSYSWQSSYGRLNLIDSIILPTDLFSGEFKNSVNATIFRGYRYYRFDIEITVRINASRTYYGSLLAAWQYVNDDEHSRYMRINHPAQLVQGPHEFIHASSNNVAKFIIPYKYVWPMIVMKPGFKLDSYCKFWLYVFNQLSSYESPSVSSGVSIFFRFVNISKSGIFYNLGLEHQMLESVLLGAGQLALEKFYRYMRADRNRDYPTNPSSGSALIPINSSSWALGTNTTFNGRILRLDAKSTTPHFDIVDEMSALHISRVFGFHSTVFWSSNQDIGVELFTTTISPLYPYILESAVIERGDVLMNTLNVYRNSPLAVISSLYSYWNGSIEYRFDFISSFMMTGKVFVCFIPSRNLLTKSLAYYTFEKCKTFYGVYFSLGEATSFTMNVPFISDHPWLQVDTRLSSSVLGYLKMFVVNPIQCGKGSQYIDINVFVRGGEGYELSVPTLPLIGLSMDNSVLGTNDFYKSWSEVYIYEYITVALDSVNYKPAVACGRDKQLQGFSPAIKKMCRGYIPTNPLLWIDDISRPFNHVLFFKTNEAAKQTFLVLNEDLREKDKVAFDIKVNKLINQVNDVEVDKRFQDLVGDRQWVKKWLCLSDASDCILLTIAGKSSYQKVARSSGVLKVYLRDFTIEHQSDDRGDSPILTQPGPLSKVTSLSYFNESFTDLKDLCRRFQFYGDYELEYSDKDSLGLTKLRIPVLVSGLISDFKSIKDDKRKFFLSANMLRSGIIPLVASGFRFYRGGLRFKLVFSAVGTCIVNFVHDRDVHADIIKISAQSAHDYNVSGYGMYGQTTFTNNIVELEIPYYRRYTQLFANRVSRTNVARHALGYIDVSFIATKTGKENDTSRVSVFYALADDSRFTTFQGFPPHVSLEDVPISAPSSSNEGRKKDEDEWIEVDHQMGSESDYDTSDSSDSEISEYLYPMGCTHSILLDTDPSDVIYSDCRKISSDPENWGIVIAGSSKSSFECIISPEKCDSCCFAYVNVDWVEKWVKYTFGFSKEIKMTLVPPVFRPYLYKIRLPKGSRIIEDELVKDLITDEMISESKSFMQRIREKCSMWCNWQVLKKVCLWIGAIALVIGGFFAIKSITSSSTGDDDHDELYAQDGPSPDKDNLRIKTRSNMKISRSVFGKAKSMRSSKYLDHQLSNSLEDIIGVLKNNIYVATLEIDGANEGSCKVTAVRGHYYIGLKHFFDKGRRAMNKGSKVNMILSKPNVKHNINMKLIQIDEGENSSLVVFKVPKHIPLARNILAHFASEADHAFIPSNCVVFDYGMNDSCRYPLVISPRQELRVPGNEHFEEVVIPFCYGYNFGYRGACGALLIGVEGIPKVYGVHVAGNRAVELELKVGFAEPITKESFPEEIQDVDHEMSLEESDGYDVECRYPNPHIDIPEQVEVLGTIDGTLAISGSPHTRKIKTPIYNEIFKSEVQPAYLCKVGDIDPMSIALAKYSKVPYTFDEKILSECSKDVSEMLICYAQPRLANGKQYLTDQEIFAGVNGYEEYPSINLQSSEGFPLCYERVNRTKSYIHFRKNALEGKSWLFDYDVSSTVRCLKRIHPVLDDLLHTNQSLREQRIVPFTVFITTLKDQCLPVEKVKAGKNRIFSNAPIQNTWAVKKYFGHFQAAYIKARFDVETSIGINPEKSEWTELLRRLLLKGDKLVTGDYSAFGDTLSRQCMIKVLEMIEDWYYHYFGDQEDYEYCKNQREMLFYEMIYGVHLARNVLFRKVAGIPSGFGLTVEFNDLVNKLYIRYAFKIITGLSMIYFRRYCYLNTYGDDMILSVHESIQDKFHFQSIQKVLKDQNIAFTSALKDESNDKFLSVYEVSYLKGKFVPHPYREGVFMHKLPLSSCLECLNWMNRGISYDRYLFNAFRHVLRYVHAYGPKEYENFRTKMIKSVIYHKNDIFPPEFRPDLPSWEEIDEELFGDGKRRNIEQTDDSLDLIDSC